MVSAPGKVILFGEHAAVYNKPAIAAAISLRSYLSVTPSPDRERCVILDFRDIGLSHAWIIDDLPWHLARSPDGEKSSPTTSSPLNALLLDAIRPHATAVTKDTDVSEEQHKIRVRSASAFLYLFLTLGSRRTAAGGSVYKLLSEVPIGAGLGSSASACVCWSAALLLQTGRIARPGEERRGERDVELISRWAFVGEQCIHGSPSGVDNAVSARGQAVLYQKTGSSGGPASITNIPSLPQLPIYLVDTQQARTTAAQVEKVREALCPETESLLDTIGEVTRSALELLSSTSDFDDNGKSRAVENLGALVRENHRLLALLGVSHPRLDRIVEIVDDLGIGWTKLTGAGGGGCAIILLRPGVSDEAKRNLENRLCTEDYKLQKTSLGAKGVGFLNYSEADGDPMKDIIAWELAAGLGKEGILHSRIFRGLED